jgi:Protein of unknown function (DUF2934)
MAKKLGNGESKPTHEEIARRARALYEQSGCRPGRDLENWLEAEAQLMAARRAASTQSKPALREPSRPALRP